MSNGTGSKREIPAAAFTHAVERPDWALSEERLPVFTVTKTHDENGAELDEPEVVAYTMPAKPNPSIALRYLKMARTQGDIASSWLIEVAVGEDGYEALVEEFETLEDPKEAMRILAAIAQKIQTVVMGGLDAGPKA